MKCVVLPTAAAGGVITALDAQARAVPVRAHRIRASVASQSPLTWDGVGAIPVAWYLAYGVLTEPGGARVAIVATDAFALGKAQFSGAANALPADWEGGP